MKFHLWNDIFNTGQRRKLCRRRRHPARGGRKSNLSPSSAWKFVLRILCSIAFLVRDNSSNPRERKKNVSSLPHLLENLFKVFFALLHSLYETTVVKKKRITRRGKNTCGDTPSYIQRASGSSVPSVRNHSTTSARCKSIRGVTPATDHTVVTCATGHSPLRPTCRRTASASSTGTSLSGRTRLVDCRRQLINHW
jgi:hypothetical protein